MVRGRNRVDEAWADIEIQLKRQYDLIPNLMEIVRGYAAHEQNLFEKITEARMRAMNARIMKEHGEAENILSSTIKSLFAVAENYPNLRASENFLELQRELTDTEDKIQAARCFYNGNVRDFNIKIQIFPNNLIAKWLGFKPRDFFGIEEVKERETIKVKF